jgi:hypothetical protein
LSIIKFRSSNEDEVDNSSSSRTQANPERDNDAFSYYSNDQVRIRTLKLWGRSSNNNQEEPHQEELAERKTRISFELHPSLILDDLLLNELSEAEEEGPFDGGDETDMGMLDLLRLQDILRVRAKSPCSVADAEGT